jgi:hypothetical protein
VKTKLKAVWLNGVAKVVKVIPLCIEVVAMVDSTIAMHNDYPSVVPLAIYSFNQVLA